MMDVMTVEHKGDVTPLPFHIVEVEEGRVEPDRGTPLVNLTDV
jgi:hypothetical protein